MLKDIETNTKENKKLFGTSGIRGKVDGEVTTNLALNVGKALATYLGGEGDVVIGYDTRTTNKMFENAITAGLLESGCDVLKIGMVPTPLVGYAVEKLDAAAGIMITASHNPSQYNGIKIWNKNGMAYTPSQEEKIEEIYYSKNFKEVGWENIGKINYIEEIKQEYIDDLLNITDIKPGLKVVIDSASGAGSEISPLIFRMAGCEVITLNSQIDGFFPGRNPEPNKANLQDLMKVVLATGADIGIAHDGDADRMMAIDENGRIGNFDKLLAIISKYMAEKSNSSNIKIITTVDAGLCMDEAITELNGEILRTKVGDVNVAEVIIEKDAVFGGEPSGTWLHPDFCMCPDGILSGLRMAEIVSKKGPLSKLLDEIPNYPNIREKIICSKEDKINVMLDMENLLIAAFANIDDINVSDVNVIDGVRLTFDDGSWVLVRPSGTEDYIRITLEAKSTDKAENIRDISSKIIKDNLN
ncbi:phosphoglucosamine mutase [Methanobrevibacter sp. TMH8]|uniref:phosphoglucosamine mutase n=1 Tax=Methanobrevibacter sp. TMH8 TaxID=2848611 RepID=UPI001CCB7B1F|nr:phosphoglucosamine mutase [Methanobrevibacter sp. TMH8]MBZ9570092.1 phosphoglucosamine mutase [Methanobrevibacter sp. TMH8]